MAREVWSTFSRRHANQKGPQNYEVIIHNGFTFVQRIGKPILLTGSNIHINTSLFVNSCLKLNCSSWFWGEVRLIVEGSSSYIPVVRNVLTGQSQILGFKKNIWILLNYHVFILPVLNSTWCQHHPVPHTFLLKAEATSCRRSTFSSSVPGGAQIRMESQH